MNASVDQARETAPQYDRPACSLMWKTALC